MKLHCNQCDTTHDVERDSEIPWNVVSIEVNCCPNDKCDDSYFEYIETYIYRDCKPRSTTIKNKNQIELF
jgi:hypothetical protein